MTKGDAGYGSARDAGSAYGAEKDANGSLAGSKDAGSGYALSSDAGPVPSAAQFGNGVNLQPSYSYGGRADLGWTLMKSVPTIRTVRILIEPNRNQEALRWITEAQDNGYDVIACYNVANELASDDPAKLQDAADWWVYNYPKLKAKTGITINVRNEWGSHGLDPQAYANAYNAALARIRTVYEKRLVIDAPGYGQGATRLYQALQTVQKPIVDRNITLSVHVYPSAFDGQTGKALQNAALKSLHGTGIPCLIGEYGSRTEHGVIAPWKELLACAKSLHWPVLAWCWAADSTGGPADPRNMNMIDSPRMQQLTKAGKDASLDPLVPGKAAVYTRSSYFREVEPYLS
jgi:mannan endo-1,4-beta-mannosidase